MTVPATQLKSKDEIWYEGKWQKIMAWWCKDNKMEIWLRGKEYGDFLRCHPQRQFEVRG